MEASNLKLGAYFQFVFPLCAHQNVWEMGREEGLAGLSLAGDAAERSRRPHEQSPGGKSCQFSRQDGEQQISHHTLCVKLGKFP